MNKKFHLVITETIDNENYEVEAKAYAESMRYGMGQCGNAPSKDRVIKHLEVTVTETEFAAIKKAALETMA